MKNFKSLIINIFIISFFVLGIISCNSDKSNIAKNETIIILHTNDMHAKIDNFPKIASFVKEYKSKYKNVFLVSAGDLFSGNPYVDKYNDKGFPMIDLMNKVGYHVSTIGNHEFDYGQEILNKRFKQAKFPFISANIKVETGKLIQPKASYTIKSKGGREIVFLGLTQTGYNNIPSTHPKKVVGLKFENFLEAVKQYNNLKKENNIFIGLTHLGKSSDIKLANAFPQFDAIIGGHSHSYIENGKKVNNVLVSQAGSNLNSIGIMTIKIKDGKIESITDKLKNIGRISDDIEIRTIVNKYKANPILKKVIGSSKYGIEGNENLGALMCDAIIKHTEATIAFQNEGGIRSNIPKGEIKIVDIYSLCPFGNDIVLFDMKYKDIKELIQKSYKKGHIKADLKVSGIKYAIFTNKEGEFKEVKAFNINGTELSKDKTYKVALNSYTASVIDFTKKDKGVAQGTTIADAIINFITEKKVVDYRNINNTKIINE